MDQEVVETDRRHRIAKRLERHPVVPRRELQLFEADSGRHRARRDCFISDPPASPMRDDRGDTLVASGREVGFPGDTRLPRT
jgi:hypothetical protein